MMIRTCNAYQVLIILSLIIVFHLEICITSYIGGYNTTMLWHNVYKHKSVDCNNLFWLHPAKTSSTFIIPVQHVCCPDLFENITSGVTREMLDDALSQMV